MSRGSIFDPSGEQTEHSGSTFTGPRADNNSHMPPDVVDGKAGDDEVADLEKLARANEEIERERQTDKTAPDNIPQDTAEPA
jgi:hypothetical protein